MYAIDGNDTAGEIKWGDPHPFYRLTYVVDVRES